MCRRRRIRASARRRHRRREQHSQIPLRMTRSGGQTLRSKSCSFSQVKLSSNCPPGGSLPRIENTTYFLQCQIRFPSSPWRFSSPRSKNPTSFFPCQIWFPLFPEQVWVICLGTKTTPPFSHVKSGSHCPPGRFGSFVSDPFSHVKFDSHSPHTWTDLVLL